MQNPQNVDYTVLCVICVGIVTYYSAPKMTFLRAYVYINLIQQFSTCSKYKRF